MVSDPTLHDWWDDASSLSPPFDRNEGESEEDFEQFIQDWEDSYL